MTDDLGGKIMTKFFGLRAKTYSYLIGLQQLKDFYKLHLIIYQILTLDTLLIFVKNVLENTIIFLVNDVTLALGNPLHFRKKIVERI